MYGRHGRMGTKPGRRDTVVSVLLRDVDQLADAGCFLYVVHTDPDDANAVWVTEVWRSAQDHQAFLELPSVKMAIVEAMPMLSGEFSSAEFHTIGGLGLPR